MISPSPHLKWWLAQSKPNAHSIAKANLERQGFEVFLPLQSITHRRRQAFVTKTQPLFPGYMFVRYGETTDSWSPINSTKGVSRLVSFGQSPATVPSGLVAGIQARCGKDNVLSSSTEFHTGESVRVEVGPFADFVATVESTAPDSRVSILLSFLGRETRLTVEAAHIRRQSS